MRVTAGESPDHGGRIAYIRTAAGSRERGGRCANGIQTCRNTARRQQSASKTAQTTHLDQNNGALGAEQGPYEWRISRQMLRTRLSRAASAQAGTTCARVVRDRRRAASETKKKHEMSQRAAILQDKDAGRERRCRAAAGWRTSRMWSRAKHAADESAGNKVLDARGQASCESRVAIERRRVQDFSLRLKCRC